ncbi:uncharacterized protein [Parasteatoda tepidariorum]|uniref:uncharacterized protein n=1 Tax=Parasteatoda tepidariorum TaxID=114398 RepID=UPI00077F971A|nr:uncharacterized protein LOC107442836 [Parasteatoda tepidariorum]
MNNILPIVDVQYSDNMKYFSGLLIFIAAGLASCDHLCYLGQVNKCRLKLNYGTDWCHSQLELSKCQKDAAIRCRTGFAEAVGNVQLQLWRICEENSFIQKDPTLSCGLKMFSDPDTTCFEDYNKDFYRPNRNPWNPVDNEKVLCKHFKTMMECYFKSIKKTCSLKEYMFFQSVMKPITKLQRKVCDFIPKL